MKRLLSLILCLATSPILAVAAETMPAYTNHAALAVCGVPVALTARTVTLSNDMETLTVALSSFPERERRRVAADYVAKMPGASISLLRLPRDIRLACEGNARDIRIARNRLNAKLLTEAQCDDFIAKAREALKVYFDQKEREGRLLPSERRALEQRPASE